MTSHRPVLRSNSPLGRSRLRENASLQNPRELAAMAGEEEPVEDDYMGDLSLFIPQEASSSSSSSRKPPGVKAPEIQPPKPKRPKGVSWQEQRKLDRERKQLEEDERTLAGLGTAIPSTNVGFKLLQQMGYNPGASLGKDGAGRSDPVAVEIRRSRAGIGAPTLASEKARKESVQREEAETKRRREENLMQEFGSRQKTQWRSRRVVGDYRKAEAALAQLENREVLEPEKDGDDEEKKEEEEEEEEITEEDLQNILMKLRDEHQYCLYCGYKYESVEALETGCPGLSEDDH